MGFLQTAHNGHLFQPKLYFLSLCFKPYANWAEKQKSLSIHVKNCNQKFFTVFISAKWLEMDLLTPNYLKNQN